MTNLDVVLWRGRRIAEEVQIDAHALAAGSRHARREFVLGDLLPAGRPIRERS